MHVENMACVVTTSAVAWRGARAGASAACTSIEVVHVQQLDRFLRKGVSTMYLAAVPVPGASLYSVTDGDAEPEDKNHRGHTHTRQQSAK